MTTQCVSEHVRQHQQELEELYQHLHRNPELSMQEAETMAELTRRLESFGYETHQIGGGVVGVLANGEGPTVLFRADVDALPVQEATGLPYASTRTMADRSGATVPAMHACGHDMHAAAGIGAAGALAAHRDAWAGTYLALFQPGEETAEGAEAMVADGLASRVPKPDVVLGQHVLTTPGAGMVATRPGPVLSTGGSLRVILRGRGSHGSMPHLGVDPVVLAASVVLRLQTIVSREVDPFQMAVVTVGSLQAGSAANIIPDDATLLLNVRAYSNEVRDDLIAAIERIVRAECGASRAPEPVIEVLDMYPLTDNDEAATARVRAAFEAHFGPDRVADMEQVPASEDFSLLADGLGAPYCYWGFGAFAEGQAVFPNHSPSFGPAMQPTLNTGAEAAATAALAWLSPGRATPLADAP